MVTAFVVNGLAVLIVVGAAAYMVRERLRRKRVRRLQRDLVISSMSGLVMGALLMGFQKIVQPELRHGITEQQKERRAEDDIGGNLPGGAVLHRQLERIRNGEDVEALEVERLDG